MRNIFFFKKKKGLVIFWLCSFLILAIKILICMEDKDLNYEETNILLHELYLYFFI